MYKITNKSTGFIQYMSLEDSVRFYLKNGIDNYSYKQIKEINTKLIGEITYSILGVISLSILITLFYFISL